MMPLTIDLEGIVVGMEKEPRCLTAGKTPLEREHKL
jgi:hypothetical protein